MSTTSDATGGAATFPAAGLDRRFHAFVLDRAVAWAVVAAAAVAAYLLLVEPGHPVAGGLVVLAVVLLVGLGSAVLLGLRGTSPGKAALGLRVVRAGSGEPIGLGPALLRTLVLGVGALPTFGLGVATLAWTAVMDRSGRRRGWHDHLARSVVVDVRPVPVLAEVAPEPVPRAIVNLTAMRLVPPPAAPVPAAPVRPRHPAATAATAGAPSAPAVADPVTPAVPVASAPPTPSSRWRVSFDTGESFVVPGLTLVGRSPEPRPGEPVHHVVALRSTDMSLSKTHAQFQVVPDGALVVMDRGSTNGSVLLRRGVPRDLAAGRPATLLHEDRVRFGDRTMTVAREA